MVGPGRGVGYGPQRGRRGPGARRGAFRAASLLLLADGPLNGYQLMQELEDRSGGTWKPSPGSVYPTLAQLEDEGLIAAVEVEGKKAYELTDAGRTHVEERREQFGTPWAPEGSTGAGEIRTLRSAAQALAHAAFQVGQTGTPEQLVAATEVLEEARRSLYGLLAERPGESGR